MKDPGDDPISGEGDLVCCDSCCNQRRATSDADATEPLCEFCRGDAKCDRCQNRAQLRIDDDELYCITHGVAAISAGSYEFPAVYKADGSITCLLFSGDRSI